MKHGANQIFLKQKKNYLTHFKLIKMKNTTIWRMVAIVGLIISVAIIGQHNEILTATYTMEWYEALLSFICIASVFAATITGVIYGFFKNGK